MCIKNSTKLHVNDPSCMTWCSVRSSSLSSRSKSPRVFFVQTTGEKYNLNTRTSFKLGQNKIHGLHKSSLVSSVLGCSLWCHVSCTVNRRSQWTYSTSSSCSLNHLHFSQCPLPFWQQLYINMSFWFSYSATWANSPPNIDQLLFIVKGLWGGAPWSEGRNTRWITENLVHTHALWHGRRVPGYF